MIGFQTTLVSAGRTDAQTDKHELHENESLCKSDTFKSTVVS